MALPAEPIVPADRARALAQFREQTADDPSDLADRIRDRLHIDLTTRYAGEKISHPFGKASGQLSCTPGQVADDVASGLAFVVLKTVIAEAADASRSMEAWAVDETRMRVQHRRGSSGRLGWTVSWSGRGWPGTLEEYVRFFAKALEIGQGGGIPIVPSVKYHLPAPDEDYRLDEYRHTTERLLDTWRAAGRPGSMPLEKDFSPTLAGDRLAEEPDTVLDWVHRVPGVLRSVGSDRLTVGIKVMNATFDDDFQLAMLASLASADPPADYWVVFNRLFDRTRGVAYGGWDLSERNLRVLGRARAEGVRMPPLSATGNIGSGRVMLEYALAGCENAQVHTFFQVPRREYTASAGLRPACALHTLLLHPTGGLVPWLWHLAGQGVIEEVGGELRFREVIGRG